MVRYFSSFIESTSYAGDLMTTSAAKPNLHTLTIMVNERPVHLEEREPTGLEIKQAAIAQGVPIELDFILVEERPNHTTRIIGDREPVEITDKSRFLANAGDDNS